MEIQIDKQKKESKLRKFLKDSLTRDLSSFTFETITYYPEFIRMMFLKMTGLGKCKQKYCNHGDYCELSRKFLTHKLFVEYFCKIDGYGPDENRIRDRGIFHTYIGCSINEK